jgi:hypothetical protein
MVIQKKGNGSDSEKDEIEFSDFAVSLDECVFTFDKRTKKQNPCESSHHCGAGDGALWLVVHR